MPSLKEIKTRIASVNSTRKITSAMKMVASSKLHHAQVMIENMLPYETMLEHILKTFLASEADASNVFTIERPVKRVAIVRLLWRLWWFPGASGGLSSLLPAPSMLCITITPQIQLISHFLRNIIKLRKALRLAEQSGLSAW